jgi:hypothetical protein
MIIPASVLDLIARPPDNDQPGRQAAGDSRLGRH